MSLSEIRTGTRCYPITSQVIKYLQQGWPNNNSEEVFKPYTTEKDGLNFQDGCLLWGNRVVVLTKERGRVVEELHETHPVICRMKALARRYVWWPKMDADLEQCSPCHKNRKSPTEAPSLGMVS